MWNFPPAIDLGGHRLGDDEPCYVIAEAGSNHNHKLQVALQLIDVAAEAGADAVKFQTFTADGLYSRKTPDIGYLKDKGLIRPGESVHELVDRIAMPWDWHQALVDHCRRREVDFLSTPFEERAVDLLQQVDVPAFKVASFEIGHLPLLEKIGQTAKPVILSSGMASLGDIELALETLYRAGTRQVALLHCAVGYPPRFEDLNLRAIETLRMAFGCPVGFSDHSLGHTSDVVAIALGACIIEKHFTLDRKLTGPDHPFSLEPKELQAMIGAIREAQAALGSTTKKRSSAEDELYTKARRSLVAAVRIPAGARIERDMLTVKRPGTGVPPSMIDWVVGRTARKDIEADDVIQADMF